MLSAVEQVSRMSSFIMKAGSPSIETYHFPFIPLKLLRDKSPEKLSEAS